MASISVDRRLMPWVAAAALAALCLLRPCRGETFGVSGVVADGKTGAAVAGARACLVRFGLCDTTDSTGRFAITGFAGVRRSAAGAKSSAPRLVAGRLCFTIAGARRSVRLDCYDPRGIRVAHLFDGVCEAGTYRIPLTPSAGAARGTCVALLSVDGSRVPLRFASVNMRGAAGYLRPDAGGYSYARKIAQFADTVFVNKAGYIPRRVPLNDTVQNLDTVRLAPLALDSLGYYGDPFASLVSKMPVFWRKRDSIDIIFLGSSHVQYGIIPPYMDTVAFHPYNMGVNGGDPRDVWTMIDQYVLHQCPKIRCIGIGLDLGFMNSDIVDRVGTSVIGRPLSQTRGYAYDRSHDFYRDGLPDGFAAAVAEVPNPYLDDGTWMGWAYCMRTGWKSAPSTAGSPFTDPWTVSDSGYVRNFNALRATADSCAARGVHVLIIDFPQNPAYTTTAWYGRYGPSWETARAAIAQVAGLASANPWVHFYDAYNLGVNDYADSEACDNDHLNGNGAIKITRRIDTLLHTFLR